MHIAWNDIKTYRPHPCWKVNSYALRSFYPEFCCMRINMVFANSSAVQKFTRHGNKPKTWTRVLVWMLYRPWSRLFRSYPCRGQTRLPVMGYDIKDPNFSVMCLSSLGMKHSLDALSIAPFSGSSPGHSRFHYSSGCYFLAARRTYNPKNWSELKEKLNKIMDGSKNI